MDEANGKRDENGRRKPEMMTIHRITKEDAWTLRHAVMWPDKPYDYIKLTDDAAGLHYGLIENGALQSVVSLFVNGTSAQFRKFATRTDQQGKGYGTALLKHVLHEAADHGAEIVWCNARVDKAGFYERFGLRRTEKEFEKDGQLYVVMEKKA